jgi:putative FmdB family regulatory protein
MPIYEYQCQKCGTFEMTQRITEKALTKCPTCKGKVKKLISNTSFQLKGTGWYVTDYARKGKNGESKDGSKSDNSKSESSSKPASDSKTESKKTESSSTSSDKSTPTTNTAST